MPASAATRPRRYNPRVKRVLTVCVALLVASAAYGEVTDRQSRTVRVPAGGAVRVDLTVGDVTVTLSNGPDLVIDATRHAPTTDDLVRMPFEVDTGHPVVRIAGVQQNLGRDAALRTDLAIALPAGVPVEAIRVFEGRVRLTGLRDGVDVDLTRGSVEATGLGGKVRLETELGSIEVRQPDLTPGGMLRLRVFNGTVRVRTARPPANARVLAVVFNGTLKSDWPLTLKDRFGPRFGEATYGTGDPVVSVDVVKGDIAFSLGR